MVNYKSKSDDQLINLLISGDELAFAEIYERYAPDLTGFAASKLFRLEDARDIIQDLFVKLWENRLELKISTNLKTYLFTIVRYRVIDHIRKNITREEYAFILQSLKLPGHINPQQQLEAKETDELIKHSLNTLSPKVKEIYLLSREENLSHTEIAQKLNISQQTVRNQLSVALKHLRNALKPLILIAIYCRFK